MVDIPKSVIDTLIAEAGGEGSEGMRRVAETILNRAAVRGLSPEQVVQQPYQYTGYSNPGPGAVQSQRNPDVRAAAEAAYQLALQPGDPTGGADHYYAQNTISQPSWARSMNNTGTYGGHTFFASRPIPPGDIPNAVGTALSTVPTAPNPATMSPDLRLMRNPVMSQSAQMSQNAPYPATQSLDMMIRRAPGQTIATVPTITNTAYNEAARLAALRANQSQIERGQFLRPHGSSAQNIMTQRNEQNMLRTPLRDARLAPSAPGMPLNTQGVTIRPPQIQVVPPPQIGRPAPTPMIASAALQARRTGIPSAVAAMPPTPARRTLTTPPVAMAYAPTAQQNSPLRVIVDGANYPNGISTAMTPVQSLQSQGYSPSQAYDLANKQARDQARERAGLSTSSGSDWWDRVTGS